MMAPNRTGEWRITSKHVPLNPGSPCVSHVAYLSAYILAPVTQYFSVSHTFAMLLCLRLCILGCCLVGLLPTCDATAVGAATCQTLSTILPGRVSFPGNSTYTTATDSWFYLENRLSPACIVTPGSAADVSSIIKELANSPSTKFAVKSGGHATNPGWSNVNNGVAIDLGSMNTITVQQERLIASVGPGAVWGDIYAALDSFNLSALGGRASGIGAAGFLLGGTLCLSFCH